VIGNGHTGYGTAVGEKNLRTTVSFVNQIRHKTGEVSCHYNIRLKNQEHATAEIHLDYAVHGAEGMLSHQKTTKKEESRRPGAQVQGL